MKDTIDDIEYQLKYVLNEYKRNKNNMLLILVVWSMLLFLAFSMYKLSSDHHNLGVIEWFFILSPLIIIYLEIKLFLITRKLKKEKEHLIKNKKSITPLELAEDKITEKTYEENT